MVNRNNNMIAKYMPNLKKVSGFGYPPLSKSMILLRAFWNGVAPKRFLTPFKFRSSRRLHNSPGLGLASG